MLTVGFSKAAYAVAALACLVASPTRAQCGPETYVVSFPEGHLPCGEADERPACATLVQYVALQNRFGGVTSLTGHSDAAGTEAEQDQASLELVLFVQSELERAGLSEFRIRWLGNRIFEGTPQARAPDPRLRFVRIENATAAAALTEARRAEAQRYREGGLGSPPAC